MAKLECNGNTKGEWCVWMSSTERWIGLKATTRLRNAIVITLKHARADDDL